MTELIRILIADDHEVVRSGLRSILEAQPRWEGVGEAADGKEAIRKAIELSPTDFDAMASLGGVLRRDGRLSEALVLYEQAVQVSAG